MEVILGTKVSLSLYGWFLLTQLKMLYTDLIKFAVWFGCTPRKKWLIFGSDPDSGSGSVEKKLRTDLDESWDVKNNWLMFGCDLNLDSRSSPVLKLAHSSKCTGQIFTKRQIPGGGTEKSKENEYIQKIWKLLLGL